MIPAAAAGRDRSRVGVVAARTVVVAAVVGVVGMQGVAGVATAVAVVVVVAIDRN